MSSRRKGMPTARGGRREGLAEAGPAMAPAPPSAAGIFFCAECGEVLSTRDEFKKHQVSRPVGSLFDLKSCLMH